MSTAAVIERPPPRHRARPGATPAPSPRWRARPLTPPSAISPQQAVASADLTGPLGTLALALDPTLIMQRAGMSPDLWQRDLLFDRSGWYLVLATRQGGKTVTLASLALHEAVTRPRSLTLVLAPSLRQAGEALRTCAQLYFALHGVPPREDAVTTLRIELGNGSRIIALPGSDDRTIRVYSAVNLLLVDEAARVPDTLFHSTMPMLATSGGRAVLSSTPWFERGFFHDMWVDGGDAWKRVEVTADQCPRISREFLERERRRMPAVWFEQEYYCRWGSAESALFPPELIGAAVSGEVETYRPRRARFL